ncbi:MAG: hypothetical protein RIR09_1791, partial [Pseudomonadota bacterium]
MHGPQNTLPRLANTGGQNCRHSRWRSGDYDHVCSRSRRLGANEFLGINPGVLQGENQKLYYGFTGFPQNPQFHACATALWVLSMTHVPFRYRLLITLLGMGLLAA